MPDLKVNLVHNPEPIYQKKNKKIAPLLITISIVIVFAVLPFVLASRFFNISPSNIWTQLKNLGINKDRLLKGETNDRVNILLLGMGGAGHDGPYLTDTMILASIRPSDNQISFLSIPRDLMVDIPGYGWRRINDANALAEVEKPGSGAEFTSALIGRVFDQPVNYYIRLDFDGFKQIVDDLDGVRVYVDKSFTDYSYPTDDFKYQTISFENGWQTMNGDTALKFVRSRHGTNGESSDFARSRRQQKVLGAVKDKLFSFESLMRPGRWNKITEDLSQHLSTNIQLWEAMRFSNFLRHVDTSKIMTKVLDSSPEGLLNDQTVGGAFVLLPKNGNWQSLKDLAANMFVSNEKVKIDVSNITVEIQNGTFLPGLAGSASVKFAERGFKIAGVGNAQKRDLTKTIIYDLTNGKKNEALSVLQEEFKNPAISAMLPPEIQSISQNQKVDFLVVLGTDSPSF